MGEFIQGASHVIFLGLLVLAILAAGYVCAWLEELANRFWPDD
jgi:hypothetical protein